MMVLKLLLIISLAFYATNCILFIKPSYIFNKCRIEVKGLTFIDQNLTWLYKNETLRQDVIKMRDDIKLLCFVTYLIPNTTGTFEFKHLNIQSYETKEVIVEDKCENNYTTKTLFYAESQIIKQGGEPYKLCECVTGTKQNWVNQTIHGARCCCDEECNTVSFLYESAH